MNTHDPEISQTHVAEGAAALWWLAQARFIFKMESNDVIYLDPYLSNVVERAFMFKRLSLAPIDTDEVHLEERRQLMALKIETWFDRL